MNDVRKMIYGTIVGFFLMLVLWFSVIYISSCGFTLTCNQAKPLVVRTPIPTLIPAAHTEPRAGEGMSEFNKCQVAASDLVGAWVSEGYSETEPFAFSDVNGKSCEGNFAADIQPLFVENSLWYTGSIGCVSCHNSALDQRSAGLDLTTYDAMQSGSGRSDASAKGNDVFGGGKWEASALYKVLAGQALVPEGHSAESPAHAIIIFAGQRIAEEENATPTP
jgi:hypothetical protein